MEEEKRRIEGNEGNGGRRERKEIKERGEEDGVEAMMYEGQCVLTDKPEGLV
mgnify:CR=1 FL=1